MRMNKEKKKKKITLSGLEDLKTNHRKEQWQHKKWSLITDYIL